MYSGKKVSVVLSTYREKKSIKSVINGFFKTGFVDEVIVVNNNAQAGTDEEVKKTKARLIYERRQGYGFGYQTGIKKASGDYIILCEPDGSYLPSDIEKFLVYAKDGFDAVLGSRTGQNTLLSGADMDVLRKWANVLEAKSIEVLFNTNLLSDVGCTYKLFTKETLKKFSKKWKVNNSLFATELLLLTVTGKTKYIEIPVIFRKRIGVSSLTAKFSDLVKWAFRIEFYIISFWLRSA